MDLGGHNTNRGLIVPAPKIDLVRHFKTRPALTLVDHVLADVRTERESERLNLSEAEDAASSPT